MKYFVYILFISITLISCSEQVEKTNDASVADSTETDDRMVSLNQQQLSSAGVEIAHPSRQNISSTITLQGSVDVPPSHYVNLSFPMGGYIKSTTMLPGKRVKKGEVLAILEDMQFIQMQQDYLMTKTEWELSTKEYQRQQTLNASKASSDKVLQQVKAQMDRQVILMNALAEKLRLIGIDAEKLSAGSISKSLPVRSPINGYVSKINISTGKYTSPTDVLFELVDPSDVHLVLKVYEKDITKISSGEKVVAFGNSEPEKRYAATVKLVNRNFDEDRSAEIHCEFVKADPALIPGMFMTAEVSVANVEAIVVPEEAVVRWNNKHYVFVQEGSGQFIMTEVKPGVLHGGKQQIENGSITASSMVVVKNAFALLMKIKNVEG